MKTGLILLLLFCVMTGSVCIAGQNAIHLGSDLQISAENVGAMILGQNVKMMMRDACYVEGEVLRATQDEILIHVRRAEPKGSSVSEQKGKDAFLKTSDIGTIYLRKGGSIAAPIALGVIGGFLGAAGAAYLAADTNSVATGFTFLTLGSAGGATAGALIGREAVKKTVTIYVVPSTR